MVKTPYKHFPPWNFQAIALLDKIQAMRQTNNPTFKSRNIQEGKKGLPK